MKRKSGTREMPGGSAAGAAERVLDKPADQATSADRPRPRGSILLLLILCLLVGAATVAVHWPVLSVEALAINDGEYVTRNYLVQNPGWDSAARFLREVRRPSTIQGYYQPLAMISLMLDAAMGGSPENLRPFHRTSLALHAANTLLIVILIYVLFGRAWPAALAGLLFGLHPMTVETVAWLGERKTPLATFFVLVSLIMYVRYARRGGWWRCGLSLAAFGLALMSKPTATPLPVVLLLLDAWPLRRLGLRAGLEKLPFFALSAVFAVITVVSQQHLEIAAKHELGLASHVLIAMHNIVFYPLKMLWPSPVSLVYPFPESIAMSDPMVLVGVIGTVLLVAGLLISLRRTRALMVGWLVFLVLVLPTFVNVGYAMGVAADKYLYLPALGFLLLIGWGLSRFWSWLASREKARVWQSGLVGIVLLIAAAEAWATRDYLDVWRSTNRLCQHILKVAPKTAWAYGQLGYDSLERGDTEAAISELTTAIELEPASPNAHLNLGRAYMSRGELDRAIAHFTQAIGYRKTFAEARSNLGIALAAKGEIDLAIEQFERAIVEKPEVPETHNNLAVALASKGRIDEAIEHYQQSLAYRWDAADVHFQLAELLARKGRVPEAMEHHALAVRFDPANVGYRTNYGIALAMNRQIDKAVEQFREAVRIDPDQAGLRNNLGRALMAAGDVPGAIEEYRRAIEADPDHLDAHNNLAFAYASAQRYADAIEHLREVLRIQPEHVDAWYNLGRLLVEQGEPEEAAKAFRAVLALDPEHAKARAGLEAALERLEGQIGTQPAGSRPATSP